MDRITRKSLKEDRFAAEVTQSVEFLTEHRRQSIIYGGVAVAVLAIGLGIYFYWQHHSTAAHAELAEALATDRAPVSDEQTPGRTSFKTEAEKNSKALAAFQSVVKDFPRSKEASIANYYIGVIDYRMGKTAEAQRQFEKVISGGDADVAGLARLTLGEIYAAQGRLDDARKIYDYLIQHPTVMVPKTEAQLALVRALRASHPEEARKLLLDLIKIPGPTSAAAGNMLRDLGQS